jgi:2-polyprenyl-3-methyl-5-hydroxy-6-metoxy-1,4-benzoquinol methylase
MSFAKRHFNAIATRYKSGSARGVWAYLRNRESLAVMKAIAPFSSMACLDLGCGAGFYTSRLVSCNPAITVAVDFSMNMLKELSEPRVKRVMGSVENIKFNMGFDRIICAGVIEFLPEINNFLANLKELLKDSGKAVLLLPRKGILGNIYKAYHWSHGITVTLYELDQLRNQLQNHRFKVEIIYSPTPVTYVLAITNG